MDSINYAGFKQAGVVKLDSGLTGNEAVNELADGLDEKEMVAIDQDRDGVITEEEFKKKFGAEGDYKKVWNAYTNALDTAAGKTDSKGNTTITQEINGSTVTSTYDKNGELVGYVTKTKNSNGKMIEKDFSVDAVTGKHTLGETKTYRKDGTLESSATTADNGASITKNYKANGTTLENVTTKNPNNTTLIQHCDKNGKLDGTTTQLTADGTAIKRDANGKILNVKYNTTERAKDKAKSQAQEIKFSYKNNELSTVTIGNKTYKGDQITVKDGKITVKDGKKKVLVMKTHSQKEEGIYLYGKDGKVDSKLLCDSNGYAKSIFNYDDNGKAKNRTYCQTGRYREYIRGKDGKVDYSLDYSLNANGTINRKLSKQTYFDQTNNDIYKNNDEALWDTRTYYDKDGNVTKYCEMDYKRNADDSVTKTTVTYSNTDKKNKVSTNIKEQDSYANTLVSKDYDAKNSLSKTTEISYLEPSVGEKKTSADVTEKKITDAATGQITIEGYNCTKLMTKDVVGKYKERYTYHDTGKIETKEYVSANDDGQTLYTYRPDGTQETETRYKKQGVYGSNQYNNRWEDTKMDSGKIDYNKQFDDKGELERNTQYDYQFSGAGSRSNIGFSKITTTDGDGNIIKQKNYGQGRDIYSTYNAPLMNEVEVFSDGSSRTNHYTLTDKDGNIIEKTAADTNHPKKIEETDKDGNTTTSFSVIGFLEANYPDLTPMQIRDISKKIAQGESNLTDSHSVLTEAQFADIDVDKYIEDYKNFR